MASFGAESSGPSGASLSPQSGLGTQSVSTASPASGARPELVVALAVIALDPSACGSGSATLTLAGDKTANCSAIGNQGSYAGGFSLSFSACTLPNGGKLDGSLTVDITRALSAGQTCGAQALVDVEHDVTIGSLSYTSSSGYVLTYANTSSTVKSTHAIGARPTKIDATLVGDRTIHDPTGKLILDQSFDGNGSVVLKDSNGVAARTLDGTFTVVHHLAKYTATVVASGVERVETCCKPIAGTVTITLVAGTTGSGPSTTATLTYGPACGAIAYDGQPLTIAECL
jgi:hypothetical protein